MKLSKLISELTREERINFQDVEVTGISYNSKTTKKGDIFVCLVGENSDGHNFAKMAEENGAVALMTEKILDTKLPQIKVQSTRHQIADIAAAFYEYPSKNINMIGVTGTNGKTTVTHLLQKIYEATGDKCGIIGTLGYKFKSTDNYAEAKHTTPQAPEFQAVLSHAVENNIKTIATEVSSHSLEQNRVGGTEFNTAVLTNLTQDHLDYHITMNNYFEAKAILFRGLKAGSKAVINNDDEYAERFKSVVPEKVEIITYGVKKDADYKAENISFSMHGAEYTLVTKDTSKKVSLQLNGMFSVYNTLAAIATAHSNGIELDTIIKVLEETKGVAGRFEAVHKHPLVIVDYAHTPDGLENVLKAAAELKGENSRLICLFGCGGDRDATKRPKMGKIADEKADIIVVTSDNPRSENPDLIISDIMAGIQTVNPKRVFVEPDRRKAIELLKKISEPADIIMVAGKGHEDYQILKDKTIHFDDREEVRKVFGSEEK
ncbi:MAG: UDP-N-acetylmuramoyl-L-alanyl-D-glutamate--2,6-diaminopimelate ligase [Candidatus Gastranaerophilales bacterium]|nr:UDP-N-acetylmuramoyl-L-alanyl-D-glutamate--2,6-diaminopimelate ligase [Candidatus Gastranaerophilales bacterium]